MHNKHYTITLYKLYLVADIPALPQLAFEILNNSNVKFSWESPTSKIDYYQYWFHLTSFNESMIVHNTSDTTVTLYDIPFNENFTFTLTVYNCIGESESVSITDKISKFFGYHN